MCASSSASKSAHVLPPCLPTPLFSTIFSFLDFRTTSLVLTSVCKQWWDACHSPLAFRDQNLILNDIAPPSVVSRWAPHFSQVKKLEITVMAYIAEGCLEALIPHVSRVQQLAVHVCPGFPDHHSAVLTNFAQAFANLTHLDIYCVMRPEEQDAILSCFCSHFPRLVRLKFINRLQHRYPSTADDAPLIKWLPSLSSLTHLHISSITLMPRVRDPLLVAIATHCPHLKNLNLNPCASTMYQLTETGIAALASGCPNLSSVHLHYCRIRPGCIKSLLTQCTSLTHIHLPDPADQSSFVSEVNAILSEHPNITRITVDISDHSPLYKSPHIRSIALKYYADTIDAADYIECNPAVTDVTIRPFQMYMGGKYTCLMFADTKRRFPNVQRLVLQRAAHADACKTEERYVSGMEDPFTYRVFF